MNILIVDDHAGCRALIRDLIARCGDRVRECESGESALECLAEFSPDWVTVDLVLPAMNGFLTLKAIRSACPAARIALVTSHDDLEYSALALALGAEAFVCKTQPSRLRDLFHGTTTP